MKAKYISFILALVLCLSVLTTVPAAAKEGQNLLPEGSFNSKADLSRFTPMHSIVAQWDEEGATSTPGSARLVGASSGKYLVWRVMTLQGETYDISFYAKCTGKASNFTIYAPFFDSDGGYCTIATSQPISTAWTKYNFTWTVPATDNKGNPVTGPSQISVRLNNATSVSETMWLDEIQVIPHGNIDVDYHSKAAYKGDWVDSLKAEKPVANAEFSDARGHWAEYTLKALSASGYVNGMGDGTYAPQSSVTRAQFITMMMNTFNIADIEYKDAYKDVTADNYYAKDLQLASQLGIINPAMTTGKMFRPDKAITREEAASILWNTVRVKGNSVAADSVKNFKDGASISTWAKEDVKSASSAGIILGDDTGNFNPAATLTRAEAATMLLRVIELDARLAVFVDPVNGDDDNAGTREAPVATVEAARAIVNPATDNMQHHIFVYLKTGEHYIEETLSLDETDSGENGYNVIYTSYGDGQAELMSGKHFTEWSLYDRDKNIYRVRVDDTKSRQVYINGVRGIRARSEGTQGLANATKEADYGHTTTDTYLADFKYIKDLEFVYTDEWTQPRGQVDSIEVKDGIAYITMDPEWWPTGSNKGASSATLPNWIENAYELLDNPGEWYLNTHDGYLYYMPRPFEDPSTMVATVPVGERLVNIYGESADNVAHNIVFDNVEFSYTTWMEPSYYGVAESQNMITQTGTRGMPGTAVRVRNGRYIDFTNCTFSKLGIAALQMFDTIQDCNVIGNHFYDISGSAVSLGQSSYLDGEMLTYRKHINPLEYKYFVINNKINNNYIHDVAVEYGASAAISAAFPKDSEINHNDIGNTIYSGMHLGWGWDTYRTMGTAMYNFCVDGNYVYQTMNDLLWDGGAMYTIGASGGTDEVMNRMTNNYLQTQHNLASYIYPDEGTTYWLFEHNVIDGSRVDTWPTRSGGFTTETWMKLYRSSIQHNVARNNYTTESKYECVEGNEYYDNTVVAPGEPWPAEAQAIIDNSGLAPEYLSRYSDGIRYIHADREVRMGVGATAPMPVKAYGRKDKVFTMPTENVYYTSSNPEIVSVDALGNITALKEGMAEVSAYVLVDDYVVKARTTVVCGEVMEEVSIGLDYLNLVEGCDVIMKPSAVTSFGRKTVPEVTYEIADETVASINPETNTITGVNTGSTTLKITFTDVTGEITKEYPVKVLPLTSSEAETMEAVSPEGSFFSAGNWSVGATADGKGVKINTPGSESINKAVAYDGLMNFDLTIDESSASGWPSFALSTDGNGYDNGDIYMIGFKSGIIELQRFNKGERTVIFGAVDGFVSVGGQGIPNNGLFEYKKTYNVTMGMIEEENGTRIILNIDGKNVFDYLDEAPARLTGSYYPIVYARTSNFILQPVGK